MASPEHPFHQQRTVFSSQDNTGGPFGGSAQSENSLVENKDAVIAFLKEIEKDTLSKVHFRYFELGPLLSALEEAGIVPSEPQNPNPFDPEVDEKSHEVWWSQHPEEGEKYSQGLEEQEKALQYIYYGAVLGRLLDKRLPKHERK